MSEEMAVSDNPSGEESVVNTDEASAASAEDAAPEAPEPPSEPAAPQPEETKPIIADIEASSSEAPEPSEEACEPNNQHGIKRRASAAFSDAVEEEFKGFEKAELNDSTVDYLRVLENLEAEVTEASKTAVPLRTVMGTPLAPVRASKRPRQDTARLQLELSAAAVGFESRGDASSAAAYDGSRPSSALSSRSDGDGTISSTEVSSPAVRGRRATTEMSSPLLRVPLERGWKRELVYRAALDQHSRRNADIYYYTPQGKKLRSTREVSEHLSGTGLTPENFSFFKEPLGVDDPEKEIIRDAKLMGGRRVESPVAAPAPVEGKRTPKPKQPKGASPEPSPKSPPSKIKVKSMGSRLSTGAPPTKAKKLASDNNNSAAWRKNRTAPAPAAPTAPTVPTPPTVPTVPTVPVPSAPAPPPPPLQSRPHSPVETKVQKDEPSPRQLVQPCSMTCGRGVPTLACAACLCLYHPACAGHLLAPQTFFCKNCRKSCTPPPEPPPLTHKSGAPPVPRRVPAHPAPAHTAPAAPAQAAHTAPAPRAQPPRPDKRVLLRMKVAGGAPDGSRVWAVAGPARAARPQPPQSIALLNGRRFIVVPRALVHHKPGRVANGSASPPGQGASPRRRGRAKPDETDHFTAFYNKAQANNYNVVVQIFQYLGMRDLARCARVCRLWRDLCATPALWRHVRMKNSHVSDWCGLAAALRRHGTRRLDLRKMLLPQNDAAFWEQFCEHVAQLPDLERIEMCRCPASAVEAVCRGVRGLRSLSALAIRSALLDPGPLGALPLLHELRLKSMAGLSLTRDLQPLSALTSLTHLSLTSIKELGWCACDVVGQLPQLESLELGECSFRAEFALVLRKLTRLRRLRLERGTAQCAAPALLRALAHLPLLTSLELVNFDVKVGFDDALAECKNIQRLLIIPTYVSQSATTNKQVLSGVLRLKDTLTHLMWGVTIELLRVTELFIDQCEQGAERRRDVGECIPVLKPVPGCRLPAPEPERTAHNHTPPQVEILPLPTLQRLLSAQMPNTKLKLLRIPFHATWRQTLADFQ